jgi:hypothetical protein
MRQASFRRQELYSGSVMELGNLRNDASWQNATVGGFAARQKGNAQQAHPGGRILKRCSRGGLVRSSDEASVMEVEQRD